MSNRHMCPAVMRHCMHEGQPQVTVALLIYLVLMCILADRITDGLHYSASPCVLSDCLCLKLSCLHFIKNT